MEKVKYICAICGSTESDSETGCCINGHDQWLELGDDIDMYLLASKNTGLSVEELRNRLTNKN